MFESTCMVYDKSKNLHVPKWKLTAEGEGMERSYTIHCFNESRMEYHPYHYTAPYITKHLRYLQDYHPERITSKLDDGTLHVYLRRMNRQMMDEVDAQVEQWKESDKEYRLADQMGDLMLKLALTTNLYARAEELLLPKIVYA